jgi:hypothetical protein
MLIEKYLPESPIKYTYSVEVNAPVNTVYKLVRNFELKHAYLLRFLFALRSIPAKLTGRALLGPSLDGLLKAGVYILDEVENQELLLALPGKIWVMAPKVQYINKEEFKYYAEPNVAKVLVNFSTQQISENKTLLTTETRALATDAHSEKMLRRYLRVMQPVSQATRISALRDLKRQAESAFKN